MRNTIEILFGAGVHPVAAPEWKKAGGAIAQGGYDTYIDTATIRRNGESVKMWHLHDFKTLQVTSGRSYLSSKNWVEYDVNHSRRRTLYFSWNAGHMGTGDTVLRMDEPSAWRPVLPGSLAAMLRYLATTSSNN